MARYAASSAIDLSGRVTAAAEARRLARQAVARAAQQRQPSEMPRYSTSSVTTAEAYDLLLDAVSYIGSGTPTSAFDCPAELSPDPASLRLARPSQSGGARAYRCRL